MLPLPIQTRESEQAICRPWNRSLVWLGTGGDELCSTLFTLDEVGALACPGPLIGEVLHRG